jgi:hypothetical protein
VDGGIGMLVKWARNTLRLTLEIAAAITPGRRSRPAPDDRRFRAPTAVRAGIRRCQAVAERPSWQSACTSL